MSPTGDSSERPPIEVGRRFHHENEGDGASSAPSPGNRSSILANVVNAISEGRWMEGTISIFDDHRSIVVAWLDVDGTQRPVYVEHRAFGWLVEGEDVESPDDLIDRPVSYCGETIEFMDRVEVA